MRKDNWQVFLFTLVFLVFLFLMIGVYIFNFHDAPVSKNAGDWGALGDYVGGLLNPVISALTLIFVGKTYLAQKLELQRVVESARLADERSERSTEAQTLMAKRYLEQIEVSNRNVKITTLSSKISFSLTIVGIYQEEMSRVSKAASENTLFTGMDGSRYGGASLLTYRSRIGDLIRHEQSKVNDFIKKIDEIKIS